MLKSRLFEERTAELWNKGEIFGEMHMGTGEEAIIASIISQLIDGDAVAADHRGTSAFLLRGTDPVELLLEFLGNENGLCKGNGGHMHLFDKEYLMSSSGIVGSSGPAACGYGLTIQNKGTSNIAVAFFGEGAMNQGMMLESLNLAAAWDLPILFVCKDNGWAITTRSEKVTGGDHARRAESFGMDATRIDGFNIDQTWKCSTDAIKYIRKRGRPFFIQATCVHRHGHFLGDPLFRFHDDMIGEFKEVGGDLMKAMVKKHGQNFIKRGFTVGQVLGSINASKGQMKRKFDPVLTCKEELDDKNRVRAIEKDVQKEIDAIVDEAMKIHKKTGEQK